MDAGLFNKKITLTIPSGSAVPDKFGQNVFTYYTASIWAEVSKTSGNQNEQSGVVRNTAYYNFTIRERDDISEDVEVTYKGDQYRISFIDDVDVKDRYIRFIGQRRN